MTNLMAEDHPVIFPKTGFRIPMMLGDLLLLSNNKTDCRCPTGWKQCVQFVPNHLDPHTDVHATNEDSMMDWEGNIKEKR